MPAKMFVHLLVMACLLSAVVVRGAAPVITSFDKVVSLYEGIKVNQPLSTITCSDPDGDLTKATIRSMSPPGPCSNCWEILDCPPAECFQYRAGVGTLSYSSAQYYLLTISCDDNKGSSVTEVIQVNIQPNSPSYFDPDVKFVELPSVTGREGPNTLLYNVDADDDEGDSITYSMTVVPSTSSSNYKIDPLTGEITSTVDLRSECGRNDVTFQVNINDGKSTTGPLVISVPFSNPNVAPVAMNLDTTVMIPEDSTGTAYPMKFTDGNGDPITYTYTANNAAGAAQFKLDGKSPNIDVAAALDYENAALRQTDLLVTASDGFCTSPPATLRLRVTDVNEKPTITPQDGSVQICEGKGEFDLGYKVTDPDIPDTVTWSFSSQTSNSQGRFSINPQTGALITLVDYDVDGDKPDRTSPMPTTNKFVVVASDKGWLTATATVTATFLDCNDNAPLFKEPAYERATTECTVGGSRLGSITATDADISAPNNVIYYEGSGGAVQVGTGGEIIVNQPLPAGSVVTFKAYAWDRGVNPGPLRSLQPTVISVRFTPCPTPPPPQTPAPATPPTTTTTTTTTPKPSATATAAVKKVTRTDDDPNLPWIIIAALLGAFMLGLLTYMLWRYGRLCADACRNINCGKTCRGRPPKPTKVAKRPVSPVRRAPVQKEKPSRPPSAAPSEPREQQPPPPGFIFGFYKERYPDDDLKGQPVRTGLPAPADMDYHYPHTFDPAVDAPPPVASTSPPQVVAGAPKKGCVIQ